MPITAPVNKSAQIRKLHADGLTAEDIAEVTGYRLSNVRAALKHQPKDKPKSRLRVEARGPLSAIEVSSITGMPIAAAKLMVR